MKTKKLFLMLAVTLAAPAAGRGAGTTAAPFLRQETTARMTGLGGAAAALYDDAGAAYFNPAGLGFMPGRRVSLSAWSGVDEKSNDSFLSGIYNSGRLGVFSLNYLRHSSGKEDIYDLGGNLSSVELAREYALGAGWGYALSENLSAGAQAKYVHSELAEAYTAKAGTLDAGLMARSDNKRFSAGIGVQNASGQLKYISDADPLPRVFYGGAAMRFPAGKGQFLLTADLQKARDESKADTHGGVEYSLAPFALRLGMRRVSGDSSFTAGGGIKLNWFSFDYGFQAAGDLNQTVHKFTLNILFDGAKDVKERKTGQMKAESSAQKMSEPEPAMPEVPPQAPEVSSTPVQPATPAAPSAEPQQGLPAAPDMPQ